MKLSRVLSVALMLLVMTTVDLSAQGMGGMGGGRGGMGGGMGRGGMGGQGGPQGGMRPEMMGEIDLVESTGFFLLDGDDVIKSCKIKSTESQAKANSMIARYHIEYDKINFEFALQIDSLKNMPELDMSAGLSEEQMQGMRRYRQIAQELREKTGHMHKELVEGMKEILNEKELKRWETYYSGICQEKFYRGGRGGQGGPGGERGERGERPSMQMNEGGGDMDYSMDF